MFGANPAWRNRLRCSGVSRCLPPPLLERQTAREYSQESSTGSLQASLELAWALQKPWPGLLFLLNLCLSPSGRASSLLQTSHILLVGPSQHLRGAGALWGCSSATFSGAVGHAGWPRAGAMGAAGQSGTAGPGLQLGVKGGRRQRQESCVPFFLILFLNKNVFFYLISVLYYWVATWWLQPALQPCLGPGWGCRAQGRGSARRSRGVCPGGGPEPRCTAGGSPGPVRQGQLHCKQVFFAVSGAPGAGQQARLRRVWARGGGGGKGPAPELRIHAWCSAWNRLPLGPVAAPPSLGMFCSGSDTGPFLR